MGTNVAVICYIVKKYRKSVITVVMEKQLQHLVMTVKLKIAREGNLEGKSFLKLYFITSKLIQIVSQIQG